MTHLDDITWVIDDLVINSIKSVRPLIFVHGGVSLAPNQDDLMVIDSTIITPNCVIICGCEMSLNISSEHQIVYLSSELKISMPYEQNLMDLF